MKFAKENAKEFAEAAGYKSLMENNSDIVDDIMKVNEGMEVLSLRSN